MNVAPTGDRFCLKLNSFQPIPSFVPFSTSQVPTLPHGFTSVGLLKSIPSPIPTVSDLVEVARDPIICISNKFPGIADAADPESTLRITVQDFVLFLTNKANCYYGLNTPYSFR